MRRRARERGRFLDRPGGVGPGFQEGMGLGLLGPLFSPLLTWES